MRATLAFALLGMSACSHPTSPAPAASEVLVSSASPSPPAPLPGPEARVVSAGFGGTGPALPPGVPNAWTAAIVEVSSKNSEVSGVRVAAISLVDAGGAVIARAIAPIDVRVAPHGRGPGDFSEDGTSPFTGTIPKGGSVLVRVHAPLDTRLEVLGKSSPEMRARFEITAANGATVVAEARAFQWASG